MKKKNLITLIGSVVLLLACIALILWKSGTFSGKMAFTEDMFAIKDSSQVNQILLADMNDNVVLLVKDKGVWKMNDGTDVMPEKIDALLSTMLNLRVDNPVAKNSIDNINRMMAAGAIKVEIYQNAPKFRLFGHNFFVAKRKVKTYYMGPATQSNMGNYAILEGMEDCPCIVYLPGFRGFATPRYSAFREDWISHRLFATKLTRLQEVSIEDFEKSEESFRVEKIDTRFFRLYDAQNQVVEHYDTSKVIDFMSQFRNLNYENTAELKPEADTIFANGPFKTITVKDVDGKTKKLALYRMPEENDYVDENGNLLTDIEYLYNRDRCYGILNDDKSTIYKVQYYHFDRVLQPMSFFLHERKRKTEN